VSVLSSSSSSSSVSVWLPLPAGHGGSHPCVVRAPCSVLAYGILRYLCAYGILRYRVLRRRVLTESVYISKCSQLHALC
jgi:hypothetical protein